GRPIFTTASARPPGKVRANDGAERVGGAATSGGLRGPKRRMNEDAMTKPQELRNRFGGVVAFPVTPFKKDLSLDLEGMRKNLQHLATFPFCAAVAAGGTGELYSLDPDDHRRVVEATVAAFNAKA